MSYTYTVEKVYAPDNAVLLRFEKEGMPPVFKRATVTSLDDAGAAEAAQKWIGFAYDQWDKIENNSYHQVSQEKYEIGFKPTVEEPAPEYDENLFELVEETVETNTQIIKRKVAQPLSPEKKQAKLDQRRADKRLALRYERDVSIDAPIDGVQVRSLNDRERIKAVISAWESLGNPDTVSWIMADNSNADLSLADLQSVLSQYNLRLAQTFATYAAKSAQVMLSEDPETIRWGE